MWRMIHGDALVELRNIPSGVVDVVLTDPPYSSGARRENARSMTTSMLRSTEDKEWFALDGLTTQGFLWMMREIGRECRRILRPGGHLLSFIDWRMAPNLAAALETADLRQQPTLIWDKTYFGMGAIFRNQYEMIIHMTSGGAISQRRDVGNVIPCKPIRSGLHPTQKPIPLLETLLSVVCPAGGFVVDPFAGSGSTGVAAVASGMNFAGIELSEEFYRIATERIGSGAR